ncbi:hypothetical protein [Marinomonas primoryensis]|jgi:hypothetical protein
MSAEDVENTEYTQPARLESDINLFTQSCITTLTVQPSSHQ